MNSDNIPPKKKSTKSSKSTPRKSPKISPKSSPKPKTAAEVEFKVTSQNGNVGTFSLPINKRSSADNIFDIRWVDPKSLRANQANWRKHSTRQRQAYVAFRERLPQELKWLSFPIYNSQTDRLVDGHMRVEEAIKNEESEIPVRYIACSEETEKLILQYFDSISGLAQPDKDALASLVEFNKKTIGKLKDARDKALAQLSQDLIMHPSGPLLKRTNSVRIPKPKAPIDDTNISSFEPSSDDGAEVSYINNHAKFAASNKWHIPDLLPSELASHYPTLTWTKSGETNSPQAYYCQGHRPFPANRVGGYLGFYTEDSYFDAAYRQADLFAEMLIQEQWRAVLLPDFSTYPDWPFPINLYNVYRSRWCGRLWQELGIPIIPTLQYLGPYTREIILETLPSPVPVLALQTRKYSGTATREFDTLLDLIRSARKINKFETLIIYGNPTLQKYIHGYLPRGPQYIYLPEFNKARRAEYKQK